MGRACQVHNTPNFDCIDCSRTARIRQAAADGGIELATGGKCDGIPRWDKQTEWTDTPVAKLKFIRSANKWRLYWMRADMKWHEYPGLSPSNRLEDLVQEIDDDPLACFFG